MMIVCLKQLVTEGTDGDCQKFCVTFEMEVSGSTSTDGDASKAERI